MNSSSVMRSIKWKTLSWPVGLFLFSLALRIYFFGGISLGDDLTEMQVVRSILDGSPVWSNHNYFRFHLWFFSWLSTFVLGYSEWTFYLPNLLLSASFASLSYYVLRTLKFSELEAGLGGLFIATAPFEVLMGTVRSNDLFLTFFINLMVLLCLLKKPEGKRLGITLGFLFWNAFYVKLWAIFWLPLLAYYFYYHYKHSKEILPLKYFLISSTVFHFLTLLFFRWQTGSFFPFFESLPGTYPVGKDQLLSTWLMYPKQIFLGSEFKTTLFGYIPYLWIFFIELKLIASVFSKYFPSHWRFHSRDALFLSLSFLFFLMLNFASHNFRFDVYFSVPRIFRYLSPFSLPLTIHLFSMMYDFLRSGGRKLPLWTFALFLCPLYALSIYQSRNATLPTVNYHNVVHALAKELGAGCPNALYLDEWNLRAMQIAFPKSVCPNTRLLRAESKTDRASQNWEWLTEHQHEFQVGTWLLVNMPSYTHYGCLDCGFILPSANDIPKVGWRKVKNLGTLKYMDPARPVQIWSWTGEGDKFPIEVAQQANRDPEGALKDAISAFNSEKFDRAVTLSRAVLHSSAPKNEATIQQAFYYYGVAVWRKKDYKATIDVFNDYLDQFQNGSYRIDASYHIAMADRALGNKEAAMTRFQSIVQEYPTDTYLMQHAKKFYEEMKNER